MPEYKQPSRRRWEEDENPIEFDGSGGGTRFTPDTSSTDSVLSDIDDALATSSLRDAEANPMGYQPTRGVNAEKKALGDSAAGKAALDAASTAASAAGSPLAGRAVQLLGKLKTRKGGGIGAGILAGVLGIIAIIMLLTPSTMLLHFKETLLAKFNDTMLVVDKRNVAILKSQLKSATGTCTVKVTCRYSGMSEKKIKSYERAGFTVVKDGEKNIFGRQKVSGLKLPSSDTLITADNIDDVMKNNLEARGMMRRAMNPSYLSYSSTAFKKIADKLNITKKKNITGTTADELDDSMDDTLDGKETSTNGGKVATDEDGNPVDEDGNRIGDTDAETGNKLNSSAAEFENVVEDAKTAGKKAAVSVTKSTVVTALTGGIGVMDSVCTGYNFIRTVGFGAKVLGSLQLIRYFYSIANTADAAMAGDGDAAAMEYIGNKLTATDAEGNNALDSFGFRYAAYGDTSLPNDEEKRSQIFQYSAGAGIGSILVGASSFVNQLSGGSLRTTCKAVKNPWSQAGMIVGGALLTFFTGGLSLTTGGAAAAIGGAALGVLMAVGTPLLINYAAGTLVTADTSGPDAGNAAVAGAGALNAQVSAASGLSPLNKEQAVAYEQETSELIALNKAADATVSSPFDFTNTNSPAYNVALALHSSFSTSSLASIFSAPQKLLASSLQTLLPTASADEDPMAQYSICTDNDYTDAGYAADPFCNVRYGLDSEALAMDPQAIVDWMYAGGHIDDNGAPKSDAFKNYIKNCIDRANPLGYEGEEGQNSTGAECMQGGSGDSSDYDYFRVYYADTVVEDSINDENTFATQTTTSTEATTTGGSSGTMVSGTDQALAQKIIASGNISGGAAAMNQINAYAAGNFSCHINPTILQLLATITQSHKIYVSSLNRFCTNTIAGAGKASYHYKNGGGHAVDIAIVDGVASTGARPNDVALIKEVAPLLPSGSQFGQSQCRASVGVSITLPTGITQFSDTCYHIHINVPVK